MGTAHLNSQPQIMHVDPRPRAHWYSNTPQRPRGFTTLHKWIDVNMILIWEGRDRGWFDGGMKTKEGYWKGYTEGYREGNL